MLKKQFERDCLKTKMGVLIALLTWKTYFPKLKDGLKCFLEFNLFMVTNFIKVAIKCFPDVGILRFLTSTHVMGFDCASGGELDKMANLSHNPSRIIFANPIKVTERVIYRV